MLTLADTVERLTDTILLSSDAFESVMWAATADLRARRARDRGSTAATPLVTRRPRTGATRARARPIAADQGRP